MTRIPQAKPPDRVSHVRNDAALSFHFIGHRGASGEAPENTLEAMRLAWAKGASGAECDVMMTRDGQIILMHDDSTKRTAGVDLQVRGTDWQRLAELDVGAWKHERWRGVRIPLLEDVLRAIPEGKKLFVEIKSGDMNQGADRAILKPLATMLRAERVSADKVVFISFDHNAMAEMKKLAPAYKAYLITTYVPFPGTWPDVRTAAELAQVIAAARRSGVDGIDLEYSPVITKEWVRMIRDAGLDTAMWSYEKDDTAEYAKRARELGVRYCTTNHPK